MSVKAIETAYKGCRFRSRLEARWAVFFDTLGLKWEYEPEGFELKSGRYLPDFRLWLTPEAYCWFEVKGRPPVVSEILKARELANATGVYAFIASGTMDVPHFRPYPGYIAAVKDGIDALATGIIEGARIWGEAPAEGARGVNMSAEQLHRTIELERSFLCGFYEDRCGRFDIDHLYVKDTGFAKPGTDAVFPIEKLRGVPDAVAVVGMRGFNQGGGRAYRSPRLVAAYAASRGARFEFGESGAAR